MAKRISPAAFDNMVDIVLAHNGTPRHRLFEYPHRDDDSRTMISKAEDVVSQILRLAAKDTELTEFSVY